MTSPTVPPPEHWLRGTHSELPAVLRAVIHAFETAQDDVHHWTADLSEAELHAAPFGLNPISFHLRHIPRSLDRLLTYAEGKQLSSEQIAALKQEFERGGPREELFTEFSVGLAGAAQRVRDFAGANLEQSRGVGRKQLPTTVGGLLVHLADHTQRHTGQIVTTAKLLKATQGQGAALGIHGLS